MRWPRPGGSLSIQGQDYVHIALFGHVCTQFVMDGDCYMHFLLILFQIYFRIQKAFYPKTLGYVQVHQKKVKFHNRNNYYEGFKNALDYR